MKKYGSVILGKNILLKTLYEAETDEEGVGYQIQMSSILDERTSILISLIEEIMAISSKIEIHVGEGPSLHREDD